MQRLKRQLRSLDRKGYGAYKTLKGTYNFGRFLLIIDHVQADPFAPGSRMIVSMSMDEAGFPADVCANESREIAFRDFLARAFYNEAVRRSRIRGSGRSGIISIPKPGQQILARSSVVVLGGKIQVRFTMGLPARGRTIDASKAEEMFFKDLPVIVENSLLYRNTVSRGLYDHIHTNEDADYLRKRLREMGLVAFVADGAVLPRASGVDDSALQSAVRFQSPESLRVKVSLPHRGEITGMGIPEGVTLIVGGGYHGKSTLLRAIERGVYNHIPGDGRELVITVADAVKIRAEDGRSIRKVDISPFISNLPLEEDTTAFSTDNASGSTSQAANIIEALEIGTSLLLIDEDTSATNFMIRDRRMQLLLPEEYEPITPFVDRVRGLWTEHGVSTVLVIGGSGEYFDVTDRVIAMIKYRPSDLTEKAKEIARATPGREFCLSDRFGRVHARIPIKESFDPSRGKKTVNIRVKGLHQILFGRQEIDLTCVEQLVDPCQTRAIAHAINYSLRYMDGTRTLREIILKTMEDIRDRGLDILTGVPTGELAMFRPQELAAAINRLRTVRMKQRR